MNEHVQIELERKLAIAERDAVRERAKVAILKEIICESIAGDDDEVIPGEIQHAQNQDIRELIIALATRPTQSDTENYKRMIGELQAQASKTMIERDDERAAAINLCKSIQQERDEAMKFNRKIGEQLMKISKEAHKENPSFQEIRDIIAATFLPDTQLEIEANVQHEYDTGTILDPFNLKNCDPKHAPTR
jgi:hypothetical protein